MQDDAFDAMTDICLRAGEVVMTSGSSDLRAAMRIVLGILAREIARRSVAAADAREGLGRAQRP